jgi:hypothetical protein
MVAATFTSIIRLDFRLPAAGPCAAHGWHPHLERAPHLVGTPDRPGIMPILRPAAHLRVAGLLRIPEGFFEVCAWCGREQPES